MSPVTSADIARTVREAIPRAASSLRPDVLAALRAAAGAELSPTGRAVLRQLVANAEIAVADGVPLCQDTGTVWVWIEVGSGSGITGDVQADVDAAVRDAYQEYGLRMSTVRDALLDRTNTGDNTPASVTVSFRPGTGATVHVMLKGGGSDNASALTMLDPSAGFEGVTRFVLEAVSVRGAGACPPLVVGVGVGGTFDSVALLAKKALMEPLDAATAPGIAEFQSDLLAAINGLGIGPAGLGGLTTALGVRVRTAPSHIASLPVAVNLGCSAMRSVTVELG
ncbi:MAG TPA: fumarate hydratase [Clostridiales bacterium]|jgi:tartrate/fumarate subfamily iron-sulfur-dependent hydro-lyase alpha chain|nr:fumarate hydratase [Clostridiales bacterium]